MKQFDLRTLNLADGDYEITVVARADGYLPSPPSDVVDYVVSEETQDALQGTWLWKKFGPDIVDVGNTETYEVNFTSNDKNYTQLSIYGVKYNNTDPPLECSEIYYDNTKVVNIKTWVDGEDKSAYRFITITDTMLGVAYKNSTLQAERLLQILQDNATKAIEGKGYLVSVCSNTSDGNVLIYNGNCIDDTKLIAIDYWTGQTTSGYITLVFAKNGVIDFSTEGNNFELETSYIDGNNKICVYKILGNCILYVDYECFAEGTQITLANGNTKAVEDITYDDELLVWDFYNGEYATAKPTWIKIEQTAYEYHKITLSNGIVMRLIGKKGHRLFSVDEQKMLYSNEIVGHRVYTLDGIATVVSCETIQEKVKFYNLTTEKHLNCFADNVLTGSRLNNMYHITDMKYDSDIRLISEEEEAERWAVRERLRK